MLVQCKPSRLLCLVFGSQGTIYAIRERRHLWSSRPSFFLAISSVVDIGIAAAFAITGIAMAPVPALLVAGTLAAAALFALALDLIKVPVFAHLGIAEKRRDLRQRRRRNRAKPNSAPQSSAHADQSGQRETCDAEAAPRSKRRQNRTRRGPQPLRPRPREIRMRSPRHRPTLNPNHRPIRRRS